MYYNYFISAIDITLALSLVVDSNANILPTDWVQLWIRSWFHISPVRRDTGRGPDGFTQWYKRHRSLDLPGIGGHGAPRWMHQRLDPGLVKLKITFSPYLSSLMLGNYFLFVSSYLL